MLISLLRESIIRIDSHKLIGYNVVVSCEIASSIDVCGQDVPVKYKLWLYAWEI